MRSVSDTSESCNSSSTGNGLVVNAGNNSTVVVLENATIVVGKLHEIVMFYRHCCNQKRIIEFFLPNISKYIC